MAYKAIGIAAKTSDDKYIIFLDYDNIDLVLLKRDLDYLIDEFSLGTYYIFKTSPEKYFVVFLDKVDYGKMMYVLNSSRCDRNYIKLINERNDRLPVMRITPKIYKGQELSPVTFLDYGHGHSSHNLSLGHYRFFRKKFNVPRIISEDFDKFESVVMIEYTTQKRSRNGKI